MKKTVTFLLTLAILLSSCFVSAMAVSSVSFQRHMIADWDDSDFSPNAPAGAKIQIPYEGYEFGKGLLTGCNIINLNTYPDAGGDTMLAMRVELSSDVNPGVAHWTSMLFYSKGFDGPLGIETGSDIYYIPAQNNQADISSYQSVSDGIYKMQTSNYNIRLEYGYNGWIMIPLSSINVDWWHGYAKVDSIKAENITALHLLADFPDGSLLDEVQTFRGSVQSFEEVSEVKPENVPLYRNLLADWDDVDLTPATPANSEVKVPYDGYEFGNGLLTGASEISLKPNSQSNDDNMLALRVKSSASPDTFGANWTQLAIYSSDFLKPQALADGGTVYYVPTATNSCSMASYTAIGTNLYQFTVNQSNQFCLEYGFDGWLVFNLSDFNVDWWYGKATIDPVEADKISKLHIISELAAGSLIDEIQTFNGTVRDFKRVCTQKAVEKPFERNMLADWDYANYSPVAVDGASVVVPYEGYQFGNALSAGTRTIALNPNVNAVGNNMIAFWIKDANSVQPGTAHWTTFLFYSSEFNRPQGLVTGSAVYYIPSSTNNADISFYEPIITGVYKKNTENHDVRIDYGYEGWIIINLDDATVDWWNSYGTMDAIKADKITAIDIVADLSAGTILDEIQTFTGSVKAFKAVSNDKMNIVLNKTDDIGLNGCGDFNEDGVIDVKDLVNLKKKIVFEASWNDKSDIFVDGAFNSKDLTIFTTYLINQ